MGETRRESEARREVLWETIRAIGGPDPATLSDSRAQALECAVSGWLHGVYPQPDFVDAYTAAHRPELLRLYVRRRAVAIGRARGCTEAEIRADLERLGIDTPPDALQALYTAFPGAWSGRRWGRRT